MDNLYTNIRIILVVVQKVEIHNFIQHFHVCYEICEIWKKFRDNFCFQVRANNAHYVPKSQNKVK